MDTDSALYRAIRENNSEQLSIALADTSLGPRELAHYLPALVTHRDRTALFKLLLAAKADIHMLYNNIDRSGTTSYSILELAVSNNQPAIVEILLAHGDDPNKPNPADSITPLMWAASRGYAEITKLFLDYNGNPDIPDSNGNTTLMLAARQHGAVYSDANYTQNSKIAKLNHYFCTIGLLLDHNARIDSINLEQQSVLDIARQDIRPFIEHYGDYRKITDRLVLAPAALETIRTPLEFIGQLLCYDIALSNSSKQDIFATLLTHKKLDLLKILCTKRFLVSCSMLKKVPDNTEIKEFLTYYYTRASLFFTLKYVQLPENYFYKFPTELIVELLSYIPNYL